MAQRLTHPATPSASFSATGLAPELVRATVDLGWSAMTPVQAEAIPAALRGGDLVVRAPTGSGKTAAFVLPILQSLAAGTTERPRKVHALVLSPTRELAAQLADVFTTCARRLPYPPRTIALSGGGSLNPQMMALRGGADIVVATPGRLLDLVEKNALRLSSVATLVLDEADRLLALGFADELERVLALLPASRTTWLFSATFPDAVRALATASLRSPTRIEPPQTGATGEADTAAGPEPTTPAQIVQRAIEVDPERRTTLLRHLLAENPWSRVLVFVATRYRADHVARKLAAAGISAASFHGELAQGTRTRTLGDFAAGDLRVLVATDLAARGLDVVGLPCVVSYDLPRSPVDHVHRVGRTGRAGEAGLALSFFDAASAAHLALIERKNRLRIPREHVEGFAPSTAAPPPSAVPPREPGQGGVKGKRKSKKDKLREAAARRGD